MSLFDYKDSSNIFLIGNGVNLMSDKTNSWLAILNQLNQRKSLKYVEGFPLTEFFDLLVVNSNKDYAFYRDLFIQRIKDKLVNKSNLHKQIYNYCQSNKILILTTNFDHSFQISNQLIPSSDSKLESGFTHYYPWQRYYIKENSHDTKLYHINGDMMYKRSIKLSVLDYAKSINFFDDNYNLNKKKRKKKYKLEETWINDFFNKDKKLVICGLDLGESELFLRHLLIQRNKYIATNRNKITGYYLACSLDFKDNMNKFDRYKLFFDSVGIKIIEYPTYQDIYSI